MMYDMYNKLLYQDNLIKYVNMSYGQKIRGSLRTQHYISISSFKLLYNVQYNDLLYFHILFSS